MVLVYDQRKKKSVPSFFKKQQSYSKDTCIKETQKQLQIFNQVKNGREARTQLPYFVKMGIRPNRRPPESLLDSVVLKRDYNGFILSPGGFTIHRESEKDGQQTPS